MTSQSQRFSSKIDRALLVAGLLPLGAGTIGCAILGARFHEPIAWVVSFLLLIAVCFVAWIYLATYYEVNGSQLYIRSGPFTRLIATDEIHSVLPSGSMLSSLALSLDRLEIQYGRRQSILVSPAQRSAFLEALAMASPGQSELGELQQKGSMQAQIHKFHLHLQEPPAGAEVYASLIHSPQVGSYWVFVYFKTPAAGD